MLGFYLVFLTVMCVMCVCVVCVFLTSALGSPTSKYVLGYRNDRVTEQPLLKEAFR